MGHSITHAEWPNAKPAAQGNIAWGAPTPLEAHAPSAHASQMQHSPHMVGSTTPVTFCVTMDTLPALVARVRKSPPSTQ